ncbi:MAG TPA: hypothetical protein VFT43_16335, partial [Candidatus Polarisedimenticolia bacterium]|nr:hypothetical protein [Candidatus Polarisedimenticolia bacterium]
MLKLRPAITILVVGALFALLGVAPFCPPARAETMPCCDPASHCDEGMRAAGCCRVEPAPEGQQAPALQSPQASRAPRPADWSLIVDPDVTP